MLDQSCYVGQFQNGFQEALTLKISTWNNFPQLFRNTELNGSVFGTELNETSLTSTTTTATTTPHWNTTFLDQSHPSSLNLTSTIITSFVSLFDLNVDLNYLRLFLCLRSELISLSFFLLFLLNQFIFLVVFPLCWSFWSWLCDIFKTIRSKQHNKHHHPESCQIFSCLQHKSFDKSNNTPIFVHRLTNFVFYKKLVVLFLIFIHLVELTIHCLVQFRPLFFTDNLTIGQPSTISLYPLLSSIVRLSALICTAWYHFRNSSKPRSKGQILVSLFSLLSLLNASLNVLLFYFELPIDLERSISIYEICNFCSWDTFPFRAIYNPLRDHHSSIIAILDNFNYFNFDLCFSWLYFVTFLIQFVLAFYPDFTEKYAISDCDTTSKTRRYSTRKNPEDCDTLFGKLFISWISSTIYCGYRRPLTKDDIFLPSDQNRSETLLNHFGQTVMKYFEKSSPLSSLSTLTDSRLRSAYNIYLLYLILIRQFVVKFIKIAAIKLVPTLLTFLTPIILGQLIQFMKSDNHQPVWHGLLYIALMFLLSCTETFLNSCADYQTSILALQTRSCLMAAIYCRLLQSKAWSWINECRYTSGEIITMMSTDTQHIFDCIKFINLLWICPLQLGICGWMLYQQISYGSIATFVVMAMTIPFNLFIGTRMKNLQALMLKSKDERIKLLNETLSGIRAVKMYAWEEKFIDRIDQCRQKEVSYLKSQVWYSAAVTFIFNSVTFFTAFASFATFLLISNENQLNAQNVFVSLAIFQIIRKPLAFIPQLINRSMMLVVSMRRIGDFLQLSEYSPDNILPNDSNRAMLTSNNHCDNHSQVLQPTILVKNCSYIWPSRTDYSSKFNSERHSFEGFILRNLNFQIEKPRLCAIVGENGSGKSSLLLALLGQMPSILESHNSQCLIRGKISYVSQHAWIQNGTVRENILFGSCFDSKRYRKVISACALSEDIKQLTNGDQAIVGERGFSLSGGQKQRISIARAIYIDADIYLFDNPLSALDSQIARHVFDRVIGPNGMLSGKIRLLVTQNMAILPHIDEILHLKNGSVVSHGLYESLMKEPNEFTEFLTTYLSSSSGDDAKKLDKNKHCPPELVVEPDEYEVLEEMAGRLERQFSSFSLRGSVRRKISRRSSLVSTGTNVIVANESNSNLSNEPAAKTPNNNEEIANTGSVSYKVYVNYVKAIGASYSVSIVLLFLIGHLFVVMNNLWLSSWSSDSKSRDQSLNGTQPAQIDWLILAMVGDVDIHNRWFRLAVYAFLGVVQTLFVLLGTLQMNLCCLAVSQCLHSKMLTRIISAPVWIFDVISGGQILNRFSKDMDIADSYLISNLRLLMLELFRTLATFFIIGIGTNSTIIIFFTPLMVVYCLIYTFYISTSRQLIRIDAVLRTPIYTHFNETFAGLSVIQAFNATKQFMYHCYSQIDANSSCYQMFLTANRWLSIRLELLGNLVVLVTGLFSVSMRGSITPAMAALSITCAFTVTNTLNMLVRSCTDIESNFVSIERLFEYTRLPQEASWHSNQIQNNRPRTMLSNSSLVYDQCSLTQILLQKSSELWRSIWSKKPATLNNQKTLICPSRSSTTWLHSGSIAVCNYSARYRTDLQLCLRNINLFINQGFKVGIVGRTGAGKSSFAMSLFRLIESESGCILIGGRQIKALGLHELRSALTIIPQDPLLFTGTLRDNLDPLNEYTDEQIILSLDKAHLGEMFRSKSLDVPIDEAQIQSISLGQKQLLCLARALLHRTKILILDEATAAIDPATDELVQTTIQTEFSQCTILAIVHRLNTVLNYDRILVLDNGQVAEFDQPANLVANHNSLFYKMLTNGL